MENIFEYTEVALKLLVLNIVDLPLEVSTSMLISILRKLLKVRRSTQIKRKEYIC